MTILEFRLTKKQKKGFDYLLSQIKVGGAVLCQPRDDITDETILRAAMISPKKALKINKILMVGKRKP